MATTTRSPDSLSRAWTGPPGRSIRYGLFARIGDWWCAIRDARTRVADLLVKAGGDFDQRLVSQADPLSADPFPPGPRTRVWSTPHTVYLSQLGRGMAEKELIRYKAEIAGHLVALRQAQAKRDATEVKLATALERLASIQPLTQDELTRRVSGEERTATAVLQGRRQREHSERRSVAENEVRQLRATLSDLAVEVAKLSEPVRIRFQVAQARVGMIDAYVRRRCAFYLTRLVRKHPEGTEIGPLLRSDWPEHPAWATREISPDVEQTPALGGGE